MPEYGLGCGTQHAVCVFGFYAFVLSCPLDKIFVNVSVDKNSYENQVLFQMYFLIDEAIKLPRGGKVASIIGK